MLIGSKIFLYIICDDTKIDRRTVRETKTLVVSKGKEMPNLDDTLVSGNKEEAVIVVGKKPPKTTVSDTNRIKHT